MDSRGLDGPCKSVIASWSADFPPYLQEGFFLLRYAQHFKAHLDRLVRLLDSGKLQVVLLRGLRGATGWGSN